MRQFILSVAAAAAVLSAGTLTRGQADPNQPNLIQQIQDNMNNAGVTPQDLIQQARDQAQQNGGFDPQAFMQNLQQQGIINQNMIDQATQMRNQFQQNMQQGNQQRQMSTMQQLMNSPDEEWAVLSVKIQKVMDLNSDIKQVAIPTNQRGFGGFGQQPNTAAQGPVGKALADLKLTLQDASATDAEIHAKLNAYRDARQHAQMNLSSAQQDLLALVTLRQEAILLITEILN